MMGNKFDRLREMAGLLLANDDMSAKARDKWGEDVKKLLQELSVYHVELEHQNAALEQSEQELAESQEKYIDLFENAPVGYVIVDAGQTIHRVNKTFTELFLPEPPKSSPVEGHSFRDYICPEYHSVFDQYCRMLAQSEPSIPLEIKMRDGYGNPHFVQITAGKRRAGARLFRLAVSDIHSRKMMEMQLLQEKDNAARRDRQKTAFLTDVSHELKTPLTTISGFCDMLMEPDLDGGTQQKYIANIKDAANAIQTLTDEAFDLNHLDSEKYVPCRIPVDIRKICDAQVFIAGKRLQDKDIAVEVELEIIPLLLGDPVRLGTIIHSILRHAVNNATGGVIGIGGHYAHTNGRNGILTLDFTGKNIFADESSEAARPTGMGLTLNCDGITLFVARQMLKSMSGKMLWTHPHDSLRIEIPFQTAIKDQTPVQGNSEADNVLKHCLLVDDVVLNLKVLAALMRRLNYLPATATSGKEALCLLAQGSYDLILTDLWMPEMNGMEFAMSARQIPQYADIPIIAVTADVERNSNFDMQYFNDTLIKPVSLEMLKERVAALFTDRKGKPVING